ncbi:MAG: glycosyltransferase family A protein [Syntrophorhabdales bacterium]|jgi:glycosyltransferase involved in cell wall biosynthesis
MVSVIITTYNRRRFLEEALASVLRQDYKDREVIVVDDGSTDDSAEVVRGLPVRYEWKENGGVSSARNHGIRRAEGDYLAFLDVDDLWKREKLSIQMAAMEAGGYGISYTDEIWLRNGRRLNQKMRHCKYSGFIYDRCLPLCIISPSSAVFKREVFNEVGFFDESLPVCEDYDMWLRICSRYPVLFIPRPLIVKRGGHADQLSRRYDVMDRFRIRSLVKMLESEALSEALRGATVAELRRKCAIVARGAGKRGKPEEARRYLLLSEKFAGRVIA